jgi:lipid II:glycine glycyltransferase (peptidoglycan interpeptide bridge formation enzyme)
MQELTGEIIRKARADLKGYVVFNLPYFRQSLVPVLEKNRFRPSIQGLPPHILITSTLLIDLFQSPEEIMAGMKAKARQNIRHGIRGGLQMREGNREDIDTFYRLMTATCDRRQAQPLFQDIGYFYHIWDHFCKNQQVRIFIVSLADEPVCAAFAFPFGNILYMWQFGWSGRYGNLNPSSVLVWNTIEWAREKGFRYYDFVSVDTEISRVIASGQPVNERLQAKYFYGPTLHKMSFGGLLIHLPGTYAYFTNKTVRWFAYNVLILMLKQHWFMNALHGFWAKIKRNSPRISNE